MKLQNFKLIPLQKCDEENATFLNNLYLDKEFQKFFGKMHFEISKTKDSIFANTYVAQKNKIPVGFVVIAHRIVRGNVMATTLYYGIDAKYRHQGFGSSLMREVSDYLLEREDINMVIMNINIENIYSQKVAEKAGFIYIPEFSDNEEYQYRKSN